MILLLYAFFRPVSITGCNRFAKTKPQNLSHMLKVFLFWPKRDKMGIILKGAFPPRKGFFTMKFSEMTYTRPDIDALLARCKELTAKAAAAVIITMEARSPVRKKAMHRKATKNTSAVPKSLISARHPTQ